MSISALGISVDAVDAALSRTADADSHLGPFPMFRKVPEGKTFKSRLHFEHQAGDVEDEAERLTRLGAKQIRSLSANNNRWISFIDPEGNDFDPLAG